MLSADEESRARAILASLERDLWAARGGSLITFGAGDAGMGAALDAVADHLGRAGTLWLDRVRSGEKSFAWWLEAVDEERKALAQYQNTQNSDGLIATALAASAATASDISAGVKELVPAANTSFKFLVVGLVAVAVLYTVSFAKGFRS